MSRTSKDIEDQIKDLRTEQRLRELKERDPVVFNARGLPGVAAALVNIRMQGAGLPRDVVLDAGQVTADVAREMEIYAKIEEEKVIESK